MTQSKTGIVRVFLLFCALGAVYSWPMALHLFDGIPYGYDARPAYATTRMYEGDHLQNYYHMGLLKYAVTGDIPWFSNPLEFAAERGSGRIFTYGLPLSLLYLPLSFFSMPLVYNLFVILSFGLGGVSMYLWASWLAGNRISGLVASLVFNFFPLRMVDLFGGHPSGFAAFLFPLTLYFFDRAVSRRSIKDGAAAGALALAMAVEYLYFAYYLLMFLMVYLPWRLVPAMARPSLAGGAWANIRRLAVAGIPFAVGIAASIGWMLYFKRSVGGATFTRGGRSMGEISLFSSPLSAMWDTSHGWQVYTGAALICALFGLVYGALSGRRNEPAKWDILFFTAIFAITYALAFGVTLDRSVPLYSLFHKYFPYFNLSRNPAKIMIIAMTALSLLSGYMAAWLVRDGAGRKRGCVLTAAFALVVAVDFHPRKAIGVCLLDEGNQTYKFIAANHGGRPILNIPVWPGESSWESIYEYYAIQSGVPMINGYSPVVAKEHVEKVFWPLFPMNTGDVSEAQHRRLKELGVSFVVFHADAFPQKVSPYSHRFTLERLKRSPYLALVRADDPLWVFAVRDKPVIGPIHETVSPLGLLFQMEKLPNIKGKKVEDGQALNGFALAGAGASPAVEGDILNAGPYITLPAGKYAVTFRVKVSDTIGGPLVRLDVAAQEGTTILAVRELTGADFPQANSYTDVTIEFNLEPGKPWQVEFRSYRLGAPEVYVDNAYLRFARTIDPVSHLEAEDIFFVGRLAQNAKASFGSAIQSTPGLPADVMVSGPGRMYDAGRHRLKARVAVGAVTGEGLAGHIEVISGNRREKLATAPIPISLFRPDGGFVEVTVDFTLTQRDTVEGRVYFGGAAPLTVDYLEITPEPARGG